MAKSLKCDEASILAKKKKEKEASCAFPVRAEPFLFFFCVCVYVCEKNFFVILPCVVVLRLRRSEKEEEKKKKEEGAGEHKDVSFSVCTRHIRSAALIFHFCSHATTFPASFCCLAPFDKTRTTSTTAFVVLI